MSSQNDMFIRCVTSVNLYKKHVVLGLKHFDIFIKWVMFKLMHVVEQPHFDMTLT